MDPWKHSFIGRGIRSRANCAICKYFLHMLHLLLAQRGRPNMILSQLSEGPKLCIQESMISRVPCSSKPVPWKGTRPTLMILRSISSIIINHFILFINLFIIIWGSNIFTNLQLHYIFRNVFSAKCMKVDTFIYSLIF